MTVLRLSGWHRAYPYIGKHAAKVLRKIESAKGNADYFLCGLKKRSTIPCSLSNSSWTLGTYSWVVNNCLPVLGFKTHHAIPSLWQAYGSKHNDFLCCTTCTACTSAASRKWINMQPEVHKYVLFAAGTGWSGNLDDFWRNLNGFLPKVAEIFPSTAAAWRWINMHFQGCDRSRWKPENILT